MKKIILCVVSMMIMVAMLVGCTTQPKDVVNYDPSTSKVVAGIQGYDTYKEFVTNYPARTSGYIDSFNKDKSEEAALWISSQLSSYGYSSAFSEQSGLQQFPYTNPITAKSETAYNVVYTKDSTTPNAKTVVIGAHYDNVANIMAGSSMIGGEGAYNNATGIAGLLELARILVDVELDYNVEFVAFGAEESGSFGSKYYINVLDKASRDDIMLMVNFDRLAGGDYVYMYSSEAKTDHNDYFYSKAEENSLNIQTLPSYLRPYMLSYADSNLIYTNEAMMSDSNVFLNNNINIVNIISMNFSDNSTATIKEKAGLGNISYTQNDTFDNMNVRLGGEIKAKSIIDAQIANAVSAVYYSMIGVDFADVMIKSEPNGGLDAMMDNKLINIISYSILAGFILILVILYFALRESVKSHPVLVDTPFGRVDRRTGKVYTSNVSPTISKKIDVFGEDASDTDDVIESADSGETPLLENKKTVDENDIFGEF